jgi:hypothetical protein
MQAVDVAWGQPGVGMCTDTSTIQMVEQACKAWMRMHRSCCHMSYHPNLLQLGQQSVKVLGALCDRHDTPDNS